MFRFQDYVWEIWHLMDAKNVAADVAFDLFRTDVEYGICDNTEGLLDVDFAALNKEWADMTDEQQSEARVQWHEMMKQHKDALREAYPDKAAMLEIVK